MSSYEPMCKVPAEPINRPIITRSHWGQHSPECYGCKLASITFDRGRPKTHVKNGNPWDGNPVKERIEELQRVGASYEKEGKKLKMAVIEKGDHAS